MYRTVWLPAAAVPKIGAKIIDIHVLIVAVDAHGHNKIISNEITFTSIFRRNEMRSSGRSIPMILAI